MNQAVKFFQDNDLKSAINSCEQALSLDPHNIEVLKLIGTIHLFMKRSYEGIKYFERIEPSKVTDPNFFDNMGMAYLQLMNLNKAIECFITATRLDPKYENAWYNLAQLYFKKEEYRKAIHYYEETLKVNPKNSRCWMNIGVAYEKLGELKKRKACYEKAVALDPLYDLAWMNLLRIYYYEKNYEEILRCYGNITNLNPKDQSEILGMVSSAYYHLENYELAINCFEIYVENVKDDKYTWATLANCYEHQNKHKEAINAINEALKLDNKFIVPYITRAIIFQKENKFIDAIKILKHALEIEPDNKHVWRTLGSIYEITGDSEKASECFINSGQAEKVQLKISIKDIDEFYIDLNEKDSLFYMANEMYGKHMYKESIIYAKKLLEKDPDYQKAWSLLGSCYDQLDELKDAIKCYEKAVALDPADTFSWSNLGTNYFRLNHLTPAIATFEKALEIDPNLQAINMKLGFCYLNQKLFEKATLSLEKAINLNKDDKVSWCGLGKVSLALGNDEKAIESFQEALKIDSCYDNAIKELIFIYGRRGDDTKRLELEKQLLELNPNDVNVLAEIGMTCKRLKKYDEAINYINKVITHDLDRGFGYLLMSSIYREIGNKSKLRDFAVKAFSLDDNNTLEMIKDEDKLLELLGFLNQQKDYEKALLLCDLALSLHPENDIIWHMLGVSYQESGNLEKALECFEKAKKLWEKNTRKNDIKRVNI